MIIVDYISRYTEQLLTDCQCNVCICQARSRKYKYLMSLIELGELEANEWIPRIGDLELAILPEHCEHHSRNLSQKHQLADWRTNDIEQ